MISEILLEALNILRTNQLQLVISEYRYFVCVCQHITSNITSKAGLIVIQR